MKLCPHCQREIQDTAIKCRWCRNFCEPTRHATKFPNLKAVEIFTFLIFVVVGSLFLLKNSYPENLMTQNESPDTAASHHILQQSFDEQWRVVSTCVGGVNGEFRSTISAKKEDSNNYDVKELVEEKGAFSTNIPNGKFDEIGFWTKIEAEVATYISDHDCVINPTFIFFESYLKQKHANEITCVLEQYKNNLSRLNYANLSNLNSRALIYQSGVGSLLRSHSEKCTSVKGLNNTGNSEISENQKNEILSNFNLVNFLAYQAVQALGGDQPINPL